MSRGRTPFPDRPTRYREVVQTSLLVCGTFSKDDDKTLLRSLGVTRLVAGN